MENQPFSDNPDTGQRGPSGFETSLMVRSQSELASPRIIEVTEPGLPLQYWHILQQRKGTFLLIVFLGLLFGLLFTFLQRPVYQARAALELQNLNENFLNMRNVNPTAGEENSYPLEYDLQTQAKILQSDSLIDRVISKLDLVKKFGLRDTNLRSAREEALRVVSRNLKIHTQANTRLVEILYDSTNPQLAADFVNALIAEFIQQNLEARWKASQQTRDWLTQQMEDVRTRLEKSEDNLQSYAANTGLLFTSNSGNVAEEKLRQLQQELSAAHADRLAKQSKYQLASTAPPESLPEVLDNKTLGEYQVKLTDLRRQRAELLSSLTEAHPRVKQVEAQMAALESALKKERTNVILGIRNEFESAQHREDLLVNSYASQAHLVSRQGAKVAHYNTLKREADTSRQLYDSLLRDVQAAAMSSALRASNVRVVDSAKPPTRPYKPRLVLNLALGLLVGVFFGMFFVVMRDHADQSIKAPGEAMLSLGVQELGVIPSVGAEQSRYFSAYSYDRQELESEDAKNPNSPPLIELATWERKPSVMADSFRATLTSILYSGENGNSPQVITVTSPNPREGKTTVASNLALALSEIGWTVLLIDGDVRRGRLHEIFKVSNASGLSELLAGEKGVAVATGCGGLYLLPAGSPVLNTSALFYQPRMLEFLAYTREKFRAVIIDTPPMLHAPDARILGRLADGVILVVRSAQTTREAAGAATQRLMEDGTRILGTILNEWDPRKTSHSSYGYTYPNYHSHGSGEERNW